SCPQYGRRNERHVRSLRDTLMGKNYCRRRMRLRLAISAVCLGLAFSAPGLAQMLPSEHEAHHAGQGQSGASSSPAPGPVEQTERGMGEMMREMGVPPRKELYPSLMALPSDLSPEKRDAIRQQAYERMTAGAGLLAEGIGALTASLESEDLAAMQDAT